MLAPMLATLLTVSGLCSTTASEPSSRPTGFVPVCREPSYNFGEVWSGTVIHHEFEVENIGTETGWVRKIVGCACLGPEFDALYRIDPGETVRIPMIVHTDRMSGKLAKTATLYVVGPDGEPIKQPAQQSQPEVSPKNSSPAPASSQTAPNDTPASRPVGFVPICRDPVYDFGEIWADGRRIEHDFEVENIGTETGWIRPSFSGALNFTPCYRIDPGQTVRIPVTFIATHLSGQISKSVRLSLVGPDGEPIKRPVLKKEDDAPATDTSPVTTSPHPVPSNTQPLPSFDDE